MPTELTQDQNPPDNGQTQTPPSTFEEWVKTQEPATVGLIETHTRGLKSALDSEREQRKTFERQLREAVKATEAGSDARKKLDELSGQLETQGRQAEFYEAAHAAGVSNLKLAWLVVQQDGLMDKQGRVNWDLFAKAYPELVARKAPVAGNAGAGTQQPPKGTGMNEFIRRSAGR